MPSDKVMGVEDPKIPRRESSRPFIFPSPAIAPPLVVYILD